MSYKNTCPPISSMKVSPEGRKSLEDIRRILRASKSMENALVVGTLVTALLHDRAIPMVYSVTSTDWEALAQALRSVPLVSRRRIKDVSALMILNADGEEREFWEAIHSLCMFK